MGCFGLLNLLSLFKIVILKRTQMLLGVTSLQCPTRPVFQTTTECAYLTLGLYSFPWLPRLDLLPYMPGQRAGHVKGRWQQKFEAACNTAGQQANAHATYARNKRLHQSVDTNNCLHLQPAQST